MEFHHPQMQVTPGLELLGPQTLDLTISGLETLDKSSLVHGHGVQEAAQSSNHPTPVAKSWGVTISGAAGAVALGP